MCKFQILRFIWSWKDKFNTNSVDMNLSASVQIKMMYFRFDTFIVTTKLEDFYQLYILM